MNHAPLDSWPADRVHDAVGGGRGVNVGRVPAAV